MEVNRIYARGKKRRVYYATDELHRLTKIASSLMGECCTEFVNLAIQERIDRNFPAEQQRVIFHPKSPV